MCTRTITAGFAAEISATVAQDAFWHLDAPVVRISSHDIPMPYHSDLLAGVLPHVDGILAGIEGLLRS